MRVSLTGKAAWLAGGPTPQDTSWETVPCECCLCKSGRFVAVDQDVPGYGRRHLAKAALREFRPFGSDAFPPPQAYGPKQKKRVARR